MLLFCEWGLLWCPDNFLQDVEIFLHSFSSLLAVWWLAAGDVHSEVRAGRGWTPAVNAESSKILLVLLASHDFFCCVQVNVTHLRRGPWWDWERHKKAEITRVRWKTSEKWWARNHEYLKENKQTLISIKLDQGRGYPLQSPVETQGLRFSISAEHCEILRRIS